MKFRHKKTGEIVYATIKASYAGGELEFRYHSYTEEYGKKCVFNNETHLVYYNSLAELNEEWEDVLEEELGEWRINEANEPENIGFGFPVEDIENLREIGLLFKSKEEAEKAVEKLKAWKRLKDKGLRFVGWQDSVSDNNPDMVLFKLDEDAWETDTCDDLDLLFSQEVE